jgi:hypothetical protein
MNYWEKGGGIFVTITSTHTREVYSSTSIRCVLVNNWSDVKEYIEKFVCDNRWCFDEIDIFTKPRLCRDCIKHATVPMIFDITEKPCECLCYVDKTPCGIHK